MASVGWLGRARCKLVAATDVDKSSAREREAFYHLVHFVNRAREENVVEDGGGGGLKVLNWKVKLVSENLFSGEFNL